jgi:hypothetical protein
MLDFGSVQYVVEAKARHDIIAGSGERYVTISNPEIESICSLPGAANIHNGDVLGMLGNIISSKISMRLLGVRG